MNRDVTLHGFCSDVFLPLREAFLQNFSDGLEMGASLAATWHGKSVVDLWGGFADRKGKVPWAEDTIACVFSSTKIATTTCGLMAIDRGLLELDEPVATYWPEFAAHGKEHITIRDVLTHRALVPAFDPPQPFEITGDWERMVAAIANQKPWFEPGTLCYHGGIYGHLVGELVRRTTGVPFQDFFLSELAGPLGADFHIGFRDRADFDRQAKLMYPAPGAPPVTGSIQEKLGQSIKDSPAGVDLRADWAFMSVPRPSANGCCNARSYARVGTVMAMRGTVDGRRYLSSGLVDEARREQCHGVCPQLGDIHMGLGFGLDGEYFRSPIPTAFHWGGWGGSWCVMDTEHELCVAYVMSRCAGGPDVMDPRQERLWAAIGEVVDQIA